MWATSSLSSRARTVPYTEWLGRPVYLDFFVHRIDGPVADGSRGQQREKQNLEIRPPIPRPQNSEFWPPTAPRPLNWDSSCPFHQSSARGEIGGPKSDRFAAISGFGPCRIPKFCPRITGGRIYMRTNKSPSATDPDLLKSRSPLKVDRRSNFEFWPKWVFFGPARPRE